MIHVNKEADNSGLANISPTYDDRTHDMMDRDILHVDSSMTWQQIDKNNLNSLRYGRIIGPKYTDGFTVNNAQLRQVADNSPLVGTHITPMITTTLYWKSHNMKNIKKDTNETEANNKNDKKPFPTRWASRARFIGSTVNIERRQIGQSWLSRSHL